MKENQKKQEHLSAKCSLIQLIITAVELFNSL